METLQDIIDDFKQQNSEDPSDHSLGDGFDSTVILREIADSFISQNAS